MSGAVERRRAAAGRAKTRTVAFDTWCLGAYARNNGVHVYAGKLLEYFRELAPQFGIEVSPYVCAALDNDANRLPAAPGFRPRETSLLKSHRVWRYGGACALAAIQGIDLVFSPHITSLSIGGLVPLVVTIHDVTPFFAPVANPRINKAMQCFLWWSAKFSRAIITDSLNSKRDLIRMFKVPESKVKVIHLAYDKAIFNATAVDPELFRSLAKKVGIQRPYILHHGVIRPNKNLKRLIQAYHMVLERNRNLDFDLVLVGESGWGYKEVVAAASPGRGHVIFAGPVNIGDLVTLIKGTDLAVFPSLYEGFCLPMIEAMACGAPTIASNSSCLPEISGGVLRYFNPESVEEMSACIEKTLQEDGCRRELSEKGQERARQFDWRRCAEETLSVLTQQLAVGG